MTTPTTNYGWPKPDDTEYAAITGVNALTDAMDASIKSVADGMGAVIKPIVQMKLNGSVSPSGGSVRYLNGTDFWEEVFYVKGNVPGTAADNQPIDFATDGYIVFSAEGLYRLTYTINVGTYTSGNGLWTAGLYDINSILVPRTSICDRMQTYTFGQGLHLSTLLKADNTGTADLTINANRYKLGLFHPIPAVSISCKPYDLDPYFSAATIEYVRGL